MAGLLERLETDLTAAVKAGDDLVRDTLRMLKTALHNKEIDKGGELTEEEIQTVLRKEAKSRQESVDSFTKGGRPEAAAKEAQEKELIEKYLPAAMSDEDLSRLVDEAIKETGAKTAADTGKVIGAVMGKARGQADGGRVAAVVKARLA